MCGIVAYVGQQEALPIIIKGLKRLEYRGYDSAGVALLDPNGLSVYKKKGKVSELEKHLESSTNLTSKIGIGHTRWATHGEPNDVNAHPHYSSSEKIAMIHNGIIENYEVLKKDLEQKGYTFQSQTDTEVFIKFIEDIQLNNDCSLEEALRLALHKVVGAYAIVLINKEEPDTLIAARKGSPLVIGVGEDEYFLASDATPIIE
jgi:glucosamine--fructose-6-phosphate aminotransferase (isomerizing)